ncbi:sulfate permease [Lutibacter sp. HS1-25]|uniref:SulP family inorganic anion transporter n=1 Tax=Lutibacter sp. HS1-25 TaxID=2485000 RepID=UPI001011320A|nr:sulfate permease [Lutibacter sp. HS1-25]RXP56572.1 sulfate permease [Lutibacter sp. HS1-25]
MNFKKAIPILNWLPNYQKKWLKGDVIAGVTVSVVLIPQGLAYAMIAGLPPIYGLYAALIPPLIYTIFGTSRNISVGPVAMDSIIVATGVSAIAAVGTEQFINLAILLGFIVGVIQLLFGLFKIGFLVNFISKPVISGFTSGAAVIIALSQVKYILGVQIDKSNGVGELVPAIIKVVGNTNIFDLFIGLSTMVLLIVFKKYLKKLPGPLVVVFIGIVIVKFLGLQVFGISIVGAIPEGLPKFTVPSFNYNTIIDLLPLALTLAIIGFMETFSIGKSIEKREDNAKISANKEFTALGLSNIVGSFFLSYIATSSFSRSAVNNNAGAKTQLSAIFSSIIVGFTLLFLTPVFFFLPKAVIASIIIVAILGLVDYKTPVNLWKYDKKDAVILIITFLVTIVLGVTEGILAGVILSLIMVIYNSTKPHIAVLGRIPGTNMYRNVERFKEVQVEEDILIIRFDSQLNFTNSSYFEDTIIDKVNEKGDKLKLVIINANSLNNVDSSGIHVVKEVFLFLKNKNIELYFTGMIGPVRDTLYKSDLMSDIKFENCFLSVQAAVDAFEAHKNSREIGGDNFKYVQQTNS